MGYVDGKTNKKIPLGGFFSNVKTTEKGLDILHFNYKQPKSIDAMEAELIKEIDKKLKSHPTTDSEYWDH